jgi:predicted nucleic acid-binding protein
VSRIVCNSGPLIALGILARLDILKSLFDEVLVPEAVQKEIEQGGIKLAGLEGFRRASWIRVVSLKEKRDELLESLLDVGEAAVISLAREQKASLVLIDERKARKVARDIFGLQPVGTARILVEAKRKNLMPEIASQFKKLEQEGYWIHSSIVEMALREAGEI